MNIIILKSTFTILILLAAVSETEKSSKELIENFDYKIGDYVEHRRMWSNIAWGWITVEVYKNKQLIHQFEFDFQKDKNLMITQIIKLKNFVVSITESSN